MRVLVVTLVTSLLEVVRTALLVSEDDAQVDALMSARAALSWIDREPGRFDIVVADADTAPMGGFALTREIKARAQTGGDVPPVVLLLARAQDKWLAEWAEADAWALKPPDPFDLADALRAVVDGGGRPVRPGIGYGGGPMRAEAKKIEREGSEGPAGGFSGGGP